MSYSIKSALHNANLKKILSDIISYTNGQRGYSFLGQPTIAIGTSSAAKVKNSAFVVVRDGLVSTIDATETAFTADVHDIAANMEATFLVYLDASNVITLLKGVEKASASVCPATPEGGLKIGTVKVATTALFDAGTTLLSAETVTDTYADVTDVAPVLADYSEKNWLYNDNLEDALTAILAVLIDSGKVKLLTNPTLVIGTSSKAKIKHSAFQIMTDGVISTIAGGEVAFTATGHDIADGKFRNFNVYLDGTTVKLLAGAEDAVTPATPTGKLKMGEVKVATAAAAFVAATTLLDAATVTDTYTNATDTTADFAMSGVTHEQYLDSKDLKDVLTGIETGLGKLNNSRVLSKPTLVIGSSAPVKIKFSTFSVMRSGVISAITGAEVAFTATTDDLADGYGAVYNVYLDGTNTVKILKGTATAGGVGAVCPATPAGGFKFGEVKVVADGDTFDATTDSLAETWITDTYTDKVDVIESIA